MDRTDQTVRRTLAAIEAPLYDVGVLSSRGMLPGLDGIPASAVLDRLPLLRCRNARGSQIYLRPSGENRYPSLFCQVWSLSRILDFYLSKNLKCKSGLPGSSSSS